MKGVMSHMLATACLLALSACSGSPQAGADAGAGGSPAAEKPSVGSFEDFIDEIRRFAGSAQVVMDGGPGGPDPVGVADRIVSGFEQYPPRRLSLDDGTTIYWGWQEGQAFIKSIAIRGADGQLQLLGAVDDLPVLYNRRANRAITERQAYEAFLRKQSERGGTPAVVLFVDDVDALAANYPLAKRWMQAALLGFNADCKDPAQGATCTFVEQVELPVQAYARDCGDAGPVNACVLEVPDVPAADVPLEAFKQ